MLLVDLDPQCNMTISGMFEDDLHNIWATEDSYIEDYEAATSKYGTTLLEKPRSIHFLLKPTEDGLDDFRAYPPVFSLPNCENVDLIPGRLSLHQYENKIAERWSGLYQNDNLAIRTITNVRKICTIYAEKNGYDYIIVDTSPSLGILNKVIISTVDGLIIPALPDMFSTYGIRNIGRSLKQWKKEFETIYQLISKDKRSRFPEKFVQFMGYTIYNAKKQSKNLNKYDLARAHYKYVEGMPQIIENFIAPENREDIGNIMDPIGGRAVMHSHNTFPAVAQALKCPMWLVPETYKKYKDDGLKILQSLLTEEPNSGHFPKYKETRESYRSFAEEFIARAEAL